MAWPIHVLTFTSCLTKIKNSIFITILPLTVTFLSFMWAFLNSKRTPNGLHSRRFLQQLLDHSNASLQQRYCALITSNFSFCVPTTKPSVSFDTEALWQLNTVQLISSQDNQLQD